MLPAYQLYLFTRKSYRLYLCDKCITDEIPKEIVERSLETQLNARIECLEDELRLTREELENCLDD